MLHPTLDKWRLQQFLQFVIAHKQGTIQAIWKDVFRAWAAVSLDLFNLSTPNTTPWLLFTPPFLHKWERDLDILFTHEQRVDFTAGKFQELGYKILKWWSKGTYGILQSLPAILIYAENVVSSMAHISIFFCSALDPSGQRWAKSLKKCTDVDSGNYLTAILSSTIQAFPGTDLNAPWWCIFSMHPGPASNHSVRNIFLLVLLFWLAKINVIWHT